MNYDQTKVRIFRDDVAELWFLTYDGLPEDTIISYSSNYAQMYSMQEILVKIYFANMKSAYEKSMNGLMDLTNGGD